MKGYKQGTRKIEKTCNQCSKKFICFISSKSKFCCRDCFLEAKVFIHNKPHTDEAKQKCRANQNNLKTRFQKGHSGFINTGSFKKGNKPWNYNGGKRSPSQNIKT
jgi:hypothetical protein